MQAKPLSVSRLSFLNLRQRPFRTGALIVVVTLLAFILFGGALLSVSLKNGLDSMKARFGADLIIIPSGYETGMKSILLTGEPGSFYFDRAAAERISGMEGVGRITTQFYLTSLGESCCELEVQLIGFDPETDFTIQPWISQVYGGRIADGALIVGSDLFLNEANAIKLFGHIYPVSSKLTKTGTGLDHSVFANRNTIAELLALAREKNPYALSNIDPATSISSVLVEVAPGYSPDAVRRTILSSLDGVQVLATQSILSSIPTSLGSFVMFVYAFAGAFLLLSLVILLALFSAMANERKKEFAVLRTLGATRSKVARAILTESLFVSAAGGTLGTALAASVVFPFSVYIGDRLGLPYLQPGTGTAGGLLLVSLLISCLVGPLAAAYSAIKISRLEPYLVLREGE